MQSEQPKQTGRWPTKPCPTCTGKGEIKVRIPARDVFQAACWLQKRGDVIGIDELWKAVNYPESTVRASVRELVAAGHLRRDTSANGRRGGAHRWLVTNQDNPPPG